MFRLSKLTDYGIVLLAHLAREQAGATHNAREVAGKIGLEWNGVKSLHEQYFNIKSGL